MKIQTKLAIFFVLFLFCNIFAIPTVNADYWGANYGAEGMGQMMDEVQKMIHDFIVGAMQQMAAMRIDSNINSLVSGNSSSGSMFINDWDDYLRRDPRRQSAIYMNDFFTDITRGRSSRMNYVSNCEDSECCVPVENPRGRCFAPTNGACPSLPPSVYHNSKCSSISECGSSYTGGFGNGRYTNNYSDYLIQGAKKSTTEIEMPQIDIQEYVCDAVDMFEDETWRAFNAFIDPNKVNNPIGFTLASQQTYLADRERRQKEAEIRAIAYQGYKAQTSGGMVTTPGSTIEAMVADAKDVSNKIVASADSIPQIIMSVVMGIVTETFQQGIGSAQSNIQKEVGSRDRNYSRGISSSLEGQSPEKSFDQIDISKNSPAHLFYDIKQ